MTAPDAQLTPLTPLAPAADPLTADRPASLWRDTLGSVLRQRSAVFGLVILMFLVFVAIFAPVLATHDPEPEPPRQRAGRREALRLRASTLLGCPADEPQHFFGTDGNFRDVYSRVLFGTRTSLTIGFAAIAFAIVVGTTIGAFAGYVGGLDRQRPDALHGRRSSRSRHCCSRSRS